MASIWQIVGGPGFYDLILSLTTGKKIRFTFNPQGTRTFKGVFEAQLLSWRVVGSYSDRVIEISGRVLAIKHPKDLNLKSAYLNFEGRYDTRHFSGEIMLSSPDGD